MTGARQHEDFRRGAWAAATAWALLALALLPSRLAVAMRVRGGPGFERVTRAVAGTVLDLSRAAWLVAALLALLVLAAVALPALRRRAQAWGAALVVLPCCVALYLVTVTEQEVKAERGAFSTLREMLDAAAQPSFVEGAPGFIRYHRILWPAVVCGGLFLVVLVRRARRGLREEPAGAGRWSAGYLSALVGGALAAQLGVQAFAYASPRLGPAGLGDPLDSVLESAVDSLRGRPPPRPLELLAQWQPSDDELARGAARLGWPPSGAACPHPYARPLAWGAAAEQRGPSATLDVVVAAAQRGPSATADGGAAAQRGPSATSDGGGAAAQRGPSATSDGGGAAAQRGPAPSDGGGQERVGADDARGGAAPAVAPRGAPPPAQALLAALEQLSRALFADGDGRVSVMQLSLEGFRADDLAALNPHAPPELAPFVNQLYARPHPGVLVSRRTSQAGVRTAQGLAAMTCGLGTLPWNLSLIRDLDHASVPLRCLSDVLVDAGFAGDFLYGSDPAYDEMGPFLSRHGLTVVGEADFPPDAPRGAWGAVADFALFDEAARRASEGVRRGPRFSLVMSLSNHSPFTPPGDLPDEVRARATALLELGPARTTATRDDLKRLVTYAYTDEAVRRLFAALDARGASERTLVLLLADHSTGDDYVWGADDFDHETDAAKTRVPLVLVIPPAWVARARAHGADVLGALAAVQRALDAEVLSQNDVPALLLALLSAHPGIVALPPAARWHTLGGQRTSGWFDAGEPGAALVGVNGVDESFALDAQGARRWPYEDAVFLRTRGDRERVTPRLAPAAAPMVWLARQPHCSTMVDSTTVE